MIPENSSMPDLTWIAFRSTIKVELGESYGQRAPFAGVLVGRDGSRGWFLNLDEPEIPIHPYILFLWFSGEVVLTPRL